MAVTAAADVTLARVNAELAEAGQWLPFDGPADASLASLVLSDTSGPLRLGYGGIRDLLTGVQFRDGRYELITVGGVTVKNVAGYDLVKFLIGSHGCFGTPATFTSRTYRRPEAAGVVAVGEEAKLNALLAGDARPQWMLRTANGLFAGYLGSEAELDALGPSVRGATGEPLTRRSPAADAAHRSALWDVEHLSARVVVPPGRVGELLSAIRGARYAAEPVFGVVLVEASDVAGLAAEAVRLGGHMTAGRERGLRVWGLSRGEAALLGRLKDQFDPDGRLPPLPLDATFSPDPVPAPAPAMAGAGPETVP